VVKPKNLKARDVDVSSTFHFWSFYRHILIGVWKNNVIFMWIQVEKTTELSRRERFAAFNFSSNSFYSHIGEVLKVELLYQHIF
jgi:cytoskeletal protein RodZ